nr:reverse transcriptase domain-containing protein [Tanacetum cinerariifolium]
LADRSISHPVGVAEDVYVKVGTFCFPADFVFVDFDVDPRVPLIFRRSSLKTKKALIDVFEGELTLRVGKEAITFNLDQNSRYSANYNDMTAKRIDVIDMAYEEYSQEVLEVDAFLALEDDPTSPEVNQSYLDSEGDILLLEAFLNDDPSLPPPNQGYYLPECMRTRSSSRLVSNPFLNPTPSTNPNPKGRNHRRSKQIIEEFNLEELSPPIVMMADQRTMTQLIQEPTEGYEDAIVVPAITTDNFELKHGLLTLVQNNRIWLEKEPPWSIFTWDDLVSKFINQFFPPSKTTNLHNEITNFQQCFDESFSEAWDRFKDLLRACPHHGFLKLHQLDTFYSALNSKD